MEQNMKGVGGSYLNEDGVVTQVEAPTKPHPDGNRARPDNRFPKPPKKAATPAPAPAKAATTAPAGKKE